MEHLEIEVGKLIQRRFEFVFQMIDEVFQVTIRWIFYYLDQSFLLHSKEFPVIREMGLIQFRNHIFSDPVLQPKVLQGACDLVDADRNEDHAMMADSSLLRNAIELFHGLDVYTTSFEPLLLSESKRFFVSWAQRESSGYLATFVENGHNLIAREVKRCELFSLNRSTKQKLSELLDRVLVADQESVLLNEKDVLGLLRTGNKTALEKLYTLLERRQLGTKLKPAFKNYIVEEGSQIVFDEEKEAEMVVSLLEFKAQLDDTWVNSFHRNEELGHALREAFATFMNKSRKSESTGGTDNVKTGEMIAKYVDRLLKGGWKLASGRNMADVPLADEDAEINRQLDQVLDLFRFVNGKAVFEAFYKNDLARRLLMGRSASDDAEKSMLARLKTGWFRYAPSFFFVDCKLILLSRMRFYVYTQSRVHVQGYGCRARRNGCICLDSARTEETAADRSKC